jgi:hypothetical protein
MMLQEAAMRAAGANAKRSLIKQYSECIPMINQGFHVTAGQVTANNFSHVCACDIVHHAVSSSPTTVLGM